MSPYHYKPSPKPKVQPPLVPAGAQAPAPPPAVSVPGPAPVGTTPPVSNANANASTVVVPPPIQASDNIVIKNAPAGKSNGIHPDVVVGFGFALMITNGFTSGQFKRIAAVITGGGSVKDKAGSSEVHKDFLVLGGEVLFVVALDMLAKASDGASNAILALLFGLWLIWSMQNVSVINNMVKKVTP